MATIIKVNEVAAYLKLHPSTIYRMLKRRELPGFKTGADWRFSRDALDKWIAEQTAKQQDGAPK